MRFLITISVLLLALAPAVQAQSSSTDNLADIARQSRTHAVQANHSWDDQNSDFGRSTEDGTPCGAPLPSLQNGYISSLLGKPIQDPELANALMRWLEKHPELDIFRPEDLARISFPMTASQAQENQEKAHAVAEQWYQQTAAGVQASNGDLTAATSAIMDAPLKSNAEVTLAQAVSIEQQRRVQSDGSTADRLKEAANLYSICESRRQMQFEPEVDKLAKQEFQKRISELAQTIGEPAKHNANNDTAKGY